MNTKCRSAVPAVAVLAVTATAGSSGTAIAAADEGSAETGVTHIVAATSPEALSVEGTAFFADRPVVVGVGLPGTAVVSGIGADLTRATISRPDPFGDGLVFTLHVADLADQFATLPERLFYEWNISPRDLAPPVVLQAMRTHQPSAPGSLEPVFRIFKEGDLPIVGGFLKPLGVGQIESVAGEMGSGVVEWHVPLSLLAELDLIFSDPARIELGAQRTGPHAHAKTRVGFEYDQHPTSPDRKDRLDQLDFATKQYILPTPSVQLGIAPAGTPDDEIVLTEQAQVLPDGTFTGSLPTADLSSGQYVILAEACYGPGNCGSKTVAVTL